MNLESIKLGFCSYLEKLNETSVKQYYSSDAEISIFLYANEFKDYIADELDVGNEILSMDVNEILNMSIVNGKLVDTNEVKTGDTFEYDTEGVEDTTEEIEDVANTEGDVAETPEENKEQTPPTIAEVIAGSENEEKTPISDIINELFEMGLFKDFVDVDKSGKIDEKEVVDFLNAIKGNDGNEEDISINDILTAMAAMASKEFSLNELKPKNSSDETTPETDTSVDAETETEATTQQNPIQNSTPSGGNSNVGGSSGSIGGNSGVTQAQTTQPQEKTLENMTKDELNSELKTAESDLSKGQEALSSILDGSDSKLESLQENIDEAYELYQEELKKVDEEMAQQVDDLQKDINSKEDEIDAKDQEIADQESTVANAETAYSNAQKTTEQLKSSLEALESTDTSDMDDAQKAELSNKITKLRSEVSKAEKAEQKAKEKLDEAKEKLETLNTERDGLQEELDGLNEQMTELEAAIAEKYPEIKEYMDAHNEAKKEYDEYKQNAISEAKTSIQESQKYVNEIQAAINDLEIKEKQKEYSIDPKSQYNAEAGRRLADAALTTRGTTGWCLAGVNDSLIEVYGQGLSFGSAYQAAEALRGNVDGYEEFSQNFVEVEVSREELASLPAGAIVVWDNNANGGGSNVSEAGRKHGHISIALGDGRESSDHIQTQMTNRDAEYSVFYPVS